MLTAPAGSPAITCTADLIGRLTSNAAYRERWDRYYAETLAPAPPPPIGGTPTLALPTTASGWSEQAVWIVRRAFTLLLDDPNRWTIDDYSGEPPGLYRSDLVDAGAALLCDRPELSVSAVFRAIREAIRFARSTDLLCD